MTGRPVPTPVVDALERLAELVPERFGVQGRAYEFKVAEAWRRVVFHSRGAYVGLLDGLIEAVEARGWCWTLRPTRGPEEARGAYVARVWIWEGGAARYLAEEHAPGPTAALAVAFVAALEDRRG